MARVKLSGRLTSGQGEGAFFARAEWARRQFMAKLGIDPYPGTLNVMVDTETDRETWRKVKARHGHTIEAPDPEWCNGRCYPVTVCGKVKGAIVLPEVENYPADQIEIIAATGIREALALRDGDPVILEIEV